LPRQASVRAKSQVDVLVMSRDDFRAIVSAFPIVDDYFDRLMRERFPDALPADVALIQKVAKTVPMLPAMRM